MDYRGDYFSDDENEGLSEKAIKRKRIRRIIFYGFVFILYLIVFIRFARSCDADLIKEIHLSDEARELYESDKQNFVVYKINTKEFMNYDGTLQLKNIVYAETAGELEIGIKYREPNEKKASEEFSLVYALTDNLGTEYEICNRVSENKNGYVYERISFKTVKLDLQYNHLNRSEKDEISDGYVDEDSERNRKLILNVSDPSIDYTEEPLIIYDNSTTYQRIKKVELAV